jgi:hypothetical protein
MKSGVVVVLLFFDWLGDMTGSVIVYVNLTLEVLYIRFSLNNLASRSDNKNNFSRPIE